MVAIFTGSGSGFERGSGSVLGNAGLLGSASFGRSGEQLLFNAANGNFLVRRSDEFLVGRGPDAAISRTYNSLGNLTDDNGDNWRQSTDRRIFGLTGTVNTAGSTVKRRSGDGSEISYSWNGSAYVATDGDGVYDTLTYASGTSVWTWTDGDTRMTETYSAYASEWRITAQTDPSGNALAFSYYASTDHLYRVTTADGAYEQYNWSGNNITEVVTGYTDFATSTAKTLTRTRYAYDGSNRLTSVTTDLSPENNSISAETVFTTTYTYDGTSKRVASISQSDGSTIAITYDGSGRVATFVQTASTGVTRTTTMGYAAGSTTITDATGQVTTLDYNADGSLKKITAPPATTGAAAQTTQFAYNANGDVTSVTDALGKVTTYANFANGLWETSTDPNGNVTTRTHDANGNLTNETRTGADQASSAAAHADRYIYDSANRLIWTISAAGIVTNYAYDGYGQLTTRTQFPLYYYNLTGVPSTTVITAAQLDSWAAGQADKTTRGIETYSYDARGGIISIKTYAATDSAGAAIAASGYAQQTLVYSQAGQLLQRRVAADNNEVFVYDGLGRMTASTDVNGATTSFAFTDLTTDGGTRTVVTLANGYVQTTVFNRAGEVISVADSGDYVTGGTTSYQYDALGRVRVATDPNNNKSYFLYDKAGRKTADIDAAGRITEYRYDADNRVVATVRWTNTVSSGNLTTLANPANTLEIAGIRPAADAADIWAWTIYDSGGRRIEAIAGDGSVQTYEYDGSDRLVRTNVFANKLNSTQLTTIKTTSPTALLVPTADAVNDRFSRFIYDSDGRVAGTLDAEGYLSRISYDGTGRVSVSRTYTNPTGTSVRATGMFPDLIASITNSSDASLTTKIYDGEGQLRFAVDALNHVTEYVYNDGVNANSDTGAARKTIQYAGSIAALSTTTVAAVQSALSTAGLVGNANNRTSYATYDAAGRLSYAIDAAGAVTGYTYDAQGQVTKTVRFATLRSTASLPTQATMVSWAAANPNAADHVTRSYYNDRLERIFSIDAEGFVTRNYYDAEGQLTEVRRFDTAVSATDAWTITTVAATVSGTYASIAYSYDPLGRVATVRDGEGHGHDYSYYGNGTLAFDIRMAGGAEESRTNYVYDATGRLTDRVDGWVSGGANPATHYVYNGRGDLVTETDPNGHTTTRTYDGNGRVLTETNAVGGVTSYQYDAFGDVVKSTDPLGNSSYNYYDRLGQLVASRDAESYITDTAYTAFGEVASVTRHSARVTNTAAVGALPAWSWATTDVPVTTSFEYDRLGRLTKATDALGAYEQYTLDAFGNRATARNKLGAITTNSFDRRGLLVSEAKAVSGNYGASGGGVANATITNRYEYDARGNRTKMIEGYGTAEARTTLYFYDRANRLTETRGMTVAVGYAGTSATPSTYYHYDGRNNLIEVIEPSGARTLSYYDKLDRKVVEIDALGTYRTFSYDAAGNMTAARAYATQVALPGVAGGTPPTAPSGSYRETGYVYDNINRLLSSSVAGQLIGAWNGTSYATSTGALTTTYQYDAAGNIIKTTAADGGLVFAYYDKLGRKTAQIDAELYRTDWSYDADGNVASERRYATRAVGTPTTASPLAVSTAADDRVTTFTYDKLGRRLTEARAGVTAWSLNTNGTLSSATGAATIAYAYNAIGEVTRKTEATGEYTDYTYDNAGRLIVETRAAYIDFGSNTVRPTVRYYYNSLGGVTSTRQGREAFAGDDRISTNSYGTGGRLESSTDAELNTMTFVYDVAGRLIGERYARNTGGASGTVQEGVSFGYDLLDRVVRQGVNAISGTTWTEVSYSQTGFNAFGEVSQRGTNGLWQEQNSYDGAGRLIRSNAGDGVWRHYVYDAAGRLTMAIESEGLDLSQMSQATALANAYTDTVNATITVYDKRGEATKAIQTQRELSVGGTRQNLTVERGYNAFGEAAWEKDALLNQTDYAYNTMGRRLQVQHPTVTSVNEAGTATSLRPTERFYYDLSGRLIGSEDANSVAAGANRVTTRKLLGGTGYGDGEALVVKEWHLDTGVTTQGFDVFGDVRVQTDELGRITQLGYDKLSHLTQLTRPGGLVESYAYDLLGQRIAHWNNVVGYAGRESTEYDAIGRIVRQTAFGGDVTATSYSWSAAIQAASFLGAGSPVPGGWQTTTTYANGKTTVDSADLYGHLVSHTDMGGHVTSYGYDRAGRVISRTLGTYSCVYDYLNTGQLGAMTVGVDTSATQGTFTQDQTVYSYDKNGNRLTEQYTLKTGDWYEYGHWENEPYYGYEQYYGYNQYWVVDGSDYVTNTTVISGSTATYDAMNRLSSWTATATATTPGSSITYAYDANSNIRRSTATFRTLDQYGTASIYATTQDYWYRFDLMNRVVTAKGVLSGGTIARGYQGADYAYDLAGQRRSMTTTATAYGQAMGEVYDPYYGYTWGYVSVPYDADHREDYSYTSDGQLLTVRIAESGYVDNGDGTVSATAAPGTGALKSTYSYDTLGRQTRQLDYLYDGDYNSTAAYDRQTTYNAKNQVASEIINQRQGADTLVTSTTNYFTDGSGYALGAVTSTYSYTTKNGSWYSSNTTTNSYGWWDGAQIASTNIVSSVSGGASTNYTTSYYYSAAGVLSSAYIGDGQPRGVSYTTDMLGQVIRRDEGYAAPHEVWYRFAERTLGYTGNNGTLNTDYQTSIYSRTATPGNGLFQGGATYAQPYGDFDQSLAPINSYSHGSSGGNYTARGGETLAAIAAQVWGDASLWYKIAEANGLSGSETLSAGQVLILPGGVSRSTHNASTFSPYDSAAAIGDTSPTAPQPQQPAKAKKKGCGVFGQILLVVIAIAVTVVTSGALAAASISAVTGTSVSIGAGLSALAGATVAGASITAIGAITIGAVAAAAGSIVSQAVGVATGLQDKFSWKGVALAALGGAIGGALGPAGVVGKGGLFGAQVGGKFVDGAIAGVRNGVLRAGLNGVASSALSQGIAVATGLQDKFDWAGVAAAGIGAAAGYATANALHIQGIDADHRSLGDYAANMIPSSASLIANAATRSLIDGSDFGDNILAGLPDVIAQTIGSMLVNGVAARDPLASDAAMGKFLQSAGGGTSAQGPAGAAVMPPPIDSGLEGSPEYQASQEISKRPTFGSSVTTWTPDQQNQINETLDIQATRMQSALDELTRWDAPAKAHFQAAFGISDEPSRQIIMGRLQNLLTINASLTVLNFQVAPRPASMTVTDYNSTFAYVYAPDKTHTIYLGPQFWLAGQTGRDTRWGTLAHEMSHWEGTTNAAVPFSNPAEHRALDGVIDPATGVQIPDPTRPGYPLAFYGPTRSALLTPSQGLFHADSFEYYLEGIPLTQPRPTPPPPPAPPPPAPAAPPAPHSGP